MKSSYTPPQVTAYGSIRRLTAAGTSGAYFDGASVMNPNHFMTSMPMLMMMGMGRN
jgi:hypothetical protein